MKRINPDKEQIKKSLKAGLIDSIRTLYSLEDEFRIVNKGMANPQDDEYLEYRKNVDNLVIAYRAKVKSYE